MRIQNRGDDTERKGVLTKAVIASAAALGISGLELARILRISTTAVNKLHLGDYFLAPGKPEWEHAVLLVRIFRSLDNLMGGSADESRKWLASQNSALSGKPAELQVTEEEGLSRVASYLLDACRSLV